MSDPSYPPTKRPETRSTSSDRAPAAFGTAELSTAGRAERTSAEQNNDGVLARVKQSATTQLAQQKDRGVEALGSVTQAVRSSTQRLRDEKHETIARYVDQAVDRIDTWTKQLKEKDVTELVTDVERLARRQPAVFIGSAFAVGLIAARFLKSSQPGHEIAAGGETYRSRYPGGARMGTASDRGVGTAEAEVAFAAREAAIPDVASSRPGTSTSAGAHTGLASGRGR
jgi:hypothetical protein